MLTIKSYSFKNNAAYKNNISFKSRTHPSLKTIEYLNDLQPNKRNFSSIDTSKIKDIFKGLNLFQGIKVQDLFTKDFSFNSILLQRGCIHQCSHCGANSPKRIKMMKWDNYTKLIDDIGTLSKRLHFNPFDNINHKVITLYHDSDPMIYRGKGSDGVEHNIFDAAKYLHEKTGKLTLIQTAGWLSEFSQKAAESMVKDSSAIHYFGISIHPFHSYMEKSISADKEGNLIESQKWRNLYTDMMANAIKTTLPLKDKTRYGIILEYAKPSVKFIDKRNQKYYSKKLAIKLYKEILKKANIENVKINKQDRGINEFGRGAILVKNKKKTFNLRSLFLKKEKHSISIDPDGVILSNPHNPGTVFFEPSPVLDNNKKPLSLKFDNSVKHE